MIKYNRYLKICIEKFPYALLLEQLKIWGRTWLIDGERKYPSEEDIMTALKMAICYPSIKYYNREEPDKPIPLEYEINNGWRYFDVRTYSNISSARTRVKIVYKASRGKSWTGVSKNCYIKPVGTIIFKVLKDGTTRNS